MGYVIEMIDITKTFPGIVANDCVNLFVGKGEIHALLGENGAGKSTLMRILFGLIAFDSGSIIKDGVEVKINNPNDANELGIGMMQQHFKLIGSLTVLENIVLGQEETKFGFLKLKEARKKALEIIEEYDFQIDLDEFVQNLAPFMQQRVELLKMLYRGNEVLIFDEPTSILTPQETDKFLDIMKVITKTGKSIIFITHKLDEIKRIADRCTILRKGKSIETVDVSKTKIPYMAEIMVGKKIDTKLKLPRIKAKETVLNLKDVNLSNRKDEKNILSNISFEVKQHQIVSIVGLEGSGQNELALLIAGILDATSGEVVFNGEDITNKSVKYRSEHGMSFIPEDREKYGLILDYSFKKNLILRQHTDSEFVKHNLYKDEIIDRYADYIVNYYNIHLGSKFDKSIRNMSDGNKQKIIVSRELDKKHNFLLAVNPTRGLDIGATEIIFKELIKQRELGYGILLVLYDLDEAMEISDRIIVMNEGEIIGELNPKKTTLQEIGLYMSAKITKEDDE